MASHATPGLIAERRNGARKKYAKLIKHMAKRYVLSMEERFPDFQMTEEEFNKLKDEIDHAMKSAS